MKRVLIVDDSKLSRNYHSYVMQNAGFAVDTANDGAAAMEKLLLESFDAVLTDINMRGMDGYEFIDACAAVNNFLSCRSLSFPRKAATMTNARVSRPARTFYLVKPAQPQQIIDSVRMMTEQS
jgi:two-component system chemotaxis response regulator CheY